MSSTSTAPEPVALAPGTLVAGKLRIVRTIGVGGMGTVYEVEHVLTKHHRALKILHAGASARIVERFVREASAAARIGNPHVAESFDAGTFDTGEPYLLMELLDGETLDQRLRRSGPLDPADLADIIHQACEGIQAAHDAGIVHRDLKPENLFITSRDGAPFVKILDFGISKFDEGRTGALGITEEGSIMGTPFYMSPEQVRGATAVDARTDVYALGVMLYECASGDRPYDAEHLTQLAVLIHEGRPVPLAQKRPALDPAFCAIVHRAMAVDPAQRFPSARAVADALVPYRRSTPSNTAPPPGTPSARVVVRPSERPEGLSGQAPAPSTMASMEAALAATLAKDAPGPKRRSLVVPAVAAAALLALAGGSFLVVTRANGHGSPPPSAASLAPTEPEPLPPPATSLAPLPPPVPCASPSASTAPAASVASARPALSASASPSAASSQRAAARSAPAPSAAPTATSRVDQKGLAGENPFR